jgi:hypothetical protein
MPATVDTCYIKDKPYRLQAVHSQNLLNAVDTDNRKRIVHKELPARLEHLQHFSIDPSRLPGA